MLIGKKVKHKTYGLGVITEFDNSYITVKFAEKTTRFPYPDAFEKFLTLENESEQQNIINEIEKKKVEAEENRLQQEAARKEEQERKLAAAQATGTKKKVKNIDEMFGEDYHVSHLARQPILTYTQVEDQFGIKISGFGRGINPTPTTVVLISSMAKSKDKFVYHDKWTADGDYIYSGEGKTGDQTLTKGNAAIVNADRDGKKIHLFVKLSPQEYYYQGVFELVNYTHEDEEDEAGKLRKEYKFRLRKVQ